MSATITGVVPMAACERGRITVYGGGFATRDPLGPDVRLGDHPLRAVAARASRLTLLIPPGVPGGAYPLHVPGVDGEHPLIEVGTVVAAGLHQVDNPVVDDQGRLYVTYSGARGEQVPVSIFRISPDGTRESLVTGLVNPTAMAFDPQGRLHVSSRFEGVVYRVDENGQYRGRGDRRGRGVRAGIRARWHALRGRSVGDDLPRPCQRPGDDDGDAAAVGGRIPSGDGSGSTACT